MNSSNEIVQSFISAFDEDLREIWEERAAIMEFDGGISRELAECLALLEVIRHSPSRVIKLIP